jgi:hypothetical protein
MFTLPSIAACRPGTSPDSAACHSWSGEAVLADAAPDFAAAEAVVGVAAAWATGAGSGATADDAAADAVVAADAGAADARRVCDEL